jgi:hypothetical protein
MKRTMRDDFVERDKRPKAKNKKLFREKEREREKKRDVYLLFIKTYFQRRQIDTDVCTTVYLGMTVQCIGTHKAYRFRIRYGYD